MNIQLNYINSHVLKEILILLQCDVFTAYYIEYYMESIFLCINFKRGKKV